ncbi:MAG: orotidine-5'-phosphate decarboxylase [Proteobacteria bacterium]|nr:orotidine-5'-phosphate decarboxylase [Pseudomonadota bacterium]
MNPSNRNDAKNRLILALDVPNLKAGIDLLDRLEGQVGIVKVGLELFTACGPSAVEEIKKKGASIFLDLKLHDIPNTVAGAVRSARALGVSMLTVHTAGGREMLSEAAKEAGEEIRLLGVTLLTSLSIEDLEPVAVLSDPKEVVRRRASLAAETGLSGVVCSPKEIEIVRDAVGQEISIVTPGIRPAGAEANDQKRATTPFAAIASGADYLVVGRPISGADDPALAASRIVDAIARALGER